MNEPASAADIDEFLREYDFSGYQSVPLAHGREIPGRDRSSEMRRLLETHSVERRKLLDVGTYYGALPAAAAGLGAIATGLEPDPERYEIASKAAELSGGLWSIRSGTIDDLEDNDAFDIVLLLNVIHHVDAPVAFLQRLASHCTGTFIVEFPLAHDISAIRYVWDDIDHSGRRPGLLVASRTYFWSWIVRFASRRLPLSYLGEDAYHRRWHFSTAAFRVIAEQLIDGVESVSIERSAWNKYRAVATITMAPRSG